MRTETKNTERRLAALLAACACILLLAAAPAAAADPAGKTYFTMIVGLEGAYDLAAGCLRFTADELCLAEGICGTWEATETTGRESGLAFGVDYENAGFVIRIDGQARVDTRGRRSSLGGTARLALAGAQQNVALAGRATSLPRCLRLAADFADMSVGWAQALCVVRADFGDPAASPYVLPYPVGDAFRVNQSYCSPGGSHHAKFSYDFNTPIGTPVLAARGGLVWMAYDGYQDGDRTNAHENTLWIEHADGSVAHYAHLAHESILVEPGETVAAGQRVATSGDTGAYPHLHFAVYRNRQLFDDNSLPVNFSNADGPLDERGGLAEGETYRALPY